MTVIKSALNMRNDEFRAKAAAMYELVDDLRLGISASLNAPIAPTKSGIFRL